MIRKLYVLIFFFVSFNCINGYSQSCAVYFNGVDGNAYLAAEQGTSIQNFTISLWFKASSPGPIFSSSNNDSSANSGVGDKRIWIDGTGTLYCGVYNGGVHVVSSNTNVMDSSCHHVAFIQNSAGIQLYIDGALKGQGTNTSGETIIPASFFWVVGHTYMIGDWQPQPPSYFYKGTVDELMIWNKAFTSTGVTDTLINLNYSNTDSNLLWYYNFNNCNSQYSVSTSELKDTLHYQGGIVPVTSSCVTNNEIITGTINGSPFCAGNTVLIPFTSTGSFNSGNVFTVQLSDTGGSFNSPIDIDSITSTSSSGTISSTLPAVAYAGSHYRIRIISSSPSLIGTPDSIDLTISPKVIPSVSILATSITICAGNPISFTAAPVNGGIAVYQWKKNGNNIGIDSTLYTDDSLKNNDSVSCTMISSISCASPDTVSSNSISVTVNSLVSPSINISATKTSICSGTPVTFTAVTSNEGTVPFYQWKKNGVDVGADSTIFSDSSLSNNDTITCVLTSNAMCASPADVSSGVITLTVSPTVHPGTITTVKDTICQNSVAHLFLNGSSGNIQWQSSSSPGNYSDITGDSTTSYVTPPLSDNTYFRVAVTDGACSDSSAALPIIVLPVPVAAFIYSITDLQIMFNSTGSSGATSYLWDFGDSSSVSTQPDPVHQFQKTGTYHVCLTLKNNSNCTFTLCQNVILSSNGVNNINNGNSWFIYPNPFSDDIFISSAIENISIESIDIYDALGREAISIKKPGTGSSSLKLDVSLLPKGMYYLKITTTTVDYIQPLIKE